MLIIIRLLTFFIFSKYFKFTHTINEYIQLTDV